MILLTSVFLLFCDGLYSKSVESLRSPEYQLKSSEDEPLNLTPLLKSGQADKARALSVVDSTLFAGVKSHAAFINVNKTGKWNTFFWFFPVDDQYLETTPWIIWLQGGPGCSSLFGLFKENGPITVSKDGKVERRKVHWGSNYSLLYIDNPIGAGFSYQEGGGEAEIYTEDQVGELLLNFTQQFLDVFPELRKAPLFITGESYAGKYIPAFGHYIHHKQDNLPINFKGVAIGDGWIDPPSLTHKGEFGLGHGFLDLEQADKVMKLELQARKYWEDGDVPKYQEAMHESNNEFLKYARIPAFNYITTDDGSNAPELANFLNRKDVKHALHVGHLKYKDCGPSYLDKTDGHLSVKPWLEELLEHYGVMCYNGELDVIVAYGLSIYTYRSLKWSGQENYLKAERKQIFMDNGQDAGFVKGYGNFMEVMVRRAGHMVPSDQPEAAKYFIDMFINKFKD